MSKLKKNNVPIKICSSVLILTIIKYISDVIETNGVNIFD